ncbi:MAG: hypothetical protein PWP27_2120 [Clostridiales bacterium]|nr:hypothetical protein [Clostridiales bacterium]MDK2934310.1 hypothetical protein [Clostridiales bacterium]
MIFLATEILSCHQAYVWYLFHSSFAVKTKNYFIIFDYYMDTPSKEPRCLQTGVIQPAEIQDDNVVVFSSHNHFDHFNPVIFNWRNKIKNIHYILSSDIRPEQHASDILLVNEGNHYTVDDMHIEVLGSTDVGVSFLVNVDGLTIFHSGDLNWWHWKDAGQSENQQMEINYKKQINLLKDKKIDLAFIPVDPRLEEFYKLSLDYFIKTVDASMVFPMHFGNDYSIFEQLKQNISVTNYYKKIVEISHRGEQFMY